MIHTVNSVSGGATSAMMAELYPADVNVFAVVCIEDCPEHKTDPAIIKYAKAKFERYCPNYPDFIATAEDDKTLVCVMELEQVLGKEIVWVRGKSFDQVIDERTKNRLPSWARRYCTVQMKLLPIFEYLYLNSFLPCLMNIGYRADETSNRIRNMYQAYDKELSKWVDKIPGPHFFQYPVSCKNFGEHKQNWADIYYRRCKFPLVKDHITKPMVDSHWKGRIDFPKISNCEGCFHKEPEVIAYKCRFSPTKMPWWIRQEKKGKGKWYDIPLTYEQINDSNMVKNPPVDLFESISNGAHCDSEGCTD